MATKTRLRIRERNDETVKLTITPEDGASDLSTVDVVSFYLKDGDCTDDTAPGVLTLTSADPTQLVIDSRTSTLITARAFIPHTAVVGAYERFFRVDCHGSAGDIRTAMFGPVDVDDL